MTASRKKKKGKTGKRDEQWEEAKKRCRLSNEDVGMAKEMGFNPIKLIKNIPNKSEPWKQPVKFWIREIYAEREEKASRKNARVSG